MIASKAGYEACIQYPKGPSVLGDVLYNGKFYWRVLNAVLTNFKNHKKWFFL